jgi:thiamine monophosphate kinase
MAGASEFELIRRFFERPAMPGRALLGIGDDCALIAAGDEGVLAVSTDMLVAGRHFFDDVEPEALGHKALAVNLSDLAAMGARPLGFTLALALPGADEAPVAPVFVDGERTVTLKGDRIAEEFQAIVEGYVHRRYGRLVTAADPSA